jgi:SOUL heme-binding protein
LLRALASNGEEDERKGDGSPGKIDGKSRVPPIVQLEKAAWREAKLSVNVEDIETRLPQGLETPAYDVLIRTKKTGYEIRRYQPFSVCSVSMSKPRPQEKSETDADSMTLELRPQRSTIHCKAV